jgi:enoyl-CoA hydratase/carnithine racemase
MVLGAGIYSAETLAQWGLVSRVVEADRLEQEGREFGVALANGPTIAHRATKRTLHAWRAGGVPAADDVTQAEGPQVIVSRDLQDAVASFKRSGPGHATFANR